MLAAAVDRINRINAAHPWSHNDLYHRWILRQLPDHPGTALDVGCGTGNLVRALAGRVGAVVGIDTDATVVETARRLSVGLPSVTVDVGDLLDAVGRYDVVTAVAVVHHLPLTTALTQLHALLAPGGTLVIVGCYRAASRTDRLVDLVAIPANLVMGLLRSTRSPDARVAMSAPTAPPETTLADIRAVAARLLPGARIRRRLFWRYSLVWTAPAVAAGATGPAR